LANGLNLNIQIYASTYKLAVHLAEFLMFVKLCPPMLKSNALLGALATLFFVLAASSSLRPSETIVANVPLQKATPGFVAVSPNGKRAYISHGFNDKGIMPAVQPKGWCVLLNDHITL